MDSGKTHSALPIKGEEALGGSSPFFFSSRRVDLGNLLELSLSPLRDLWTCLTLNRNMTLSRKSGTLLLVVVAAVCIQFYQAHDIPGRCLCSNTIKFIKGNMSNFQFYEKRPGCDETELIVTLSKSDNSTEKFCINTGGKMAKAFLRCWEKINKDEGRKMECLDRKRKAE